MCTAAAKGDNPKPPSPGKTEQGRTPNKIKDFPMSKNSLLVAVMKYADANNLNISMSQCQRMIRTALRRMKKEEIRTVIGWAETTDDFKAISYSDSTGETAVRNIMKILNSGYVSEFGV